MTIFNIRRRMANDDLSPEEIDEQMSQLSEQRNDDERDRQAEELYKEQP